MGSIGIGAVVLAVSANAALATAALAQPRFDTEAYCRSVSTDQGQLSPSRLQYCLSTEHSSLGRLRAEWSRVPDGMRTHCAYVASAAGHGAAGQGSYGSFVTCVEAGRDTGGRD